MHGRENPNDPAARNNYYEGEPVFSIKYGEDVVQSDSTIDLGDVTVGGVSADAVFSIGNTGTGYLELDKMEITKSDAYSVIETPVTPVDPGTSSDLIIRFSPPAAGKYMVKVTIYYSGNISYTNGSYTNGSDTFSFSLSGIGI